MWYEFLNGVNTAQEDCRDTHKEGWRKEVLDEPKLDAAVGITQHAQDHDRGETL